MEKPIRVLQVLPALNFCGGIESYVMNYYRHIDREKVQFDFVTHTDLECSYRQEIEDLGGRIYDFPPIGLFSLRDVLRKIDGLFAQNKGRYAAVHCHMANAACFYFHIAKKYGIHTLILHSHNSEASDIFFHAIRNYPLLKMGVAMATQKVACSDLAGKFLYGKKPFIEIHNAIETETFAFDPDRRKSLREKLGWEDKIVIGHIGRMVPQKNQSFLLDIFYELQKRNSSYHLAMVGQGNDEKDIRQKIKTLGIAEKTEIFPPTKHVADYYCAFDAFVLPSLYEGLGLVLVEAQCSGLSVYSACDSIPKEVKMTSDFHFLSLKQPPAQWADTLDATINRQRESKSFELQIAGYDIHAEAHKLEDLYLQGIEMGDAVS